MKKNCLLTIILFAGCVSVPFNRVEMIPLPDLTPDEVMQRFVARIPGECRLTMTVVFKMKWHRFMALGYVSLDRLNESLVMAMVNPIGVKLFEIQVKDGAIVKISASDDLRKQQQFLEALALDMSRIYFDLVPEKTDNVMLTNTRMIFIYGDHQDGIEYEFVGTGPVLTEKRYYEKGSQIVDVSYYEYLTINNYVYAGGVILKNHRFRYTVMARLVEVEADGNVIPVSGR